MAVKEVTWLGEDDRRGAHMRRALFPWRDTNVEGEALLQGALSMRLTKVTAYRQTLCKIGEEDYLRRKLLGESDPKVEAAYAENSPLMEIDRQGLLAISPTSRLPSPLGPPICDVALMSCRLILQTPIGLGSMCVYLCEDGSRRQYYQPIGPCPYDYLAR